MHGFRPIRLLLFVILLLPASVAAQEWADVIHVVDGDTIVLENGEKVRYIGIDAPEIAHENRPAQPYGDAAHAFNRKITGSNGRVRLEYGVERRDRYGRQLAYVFLEDGTFINQAMLSAGMAVFLFKAPNLAYADRLLRAQRTAMREKRGLWGDPVDGRGAYIGNRRSMRFHLPTCPYGRRTAQSNRVAFDRRWDAYWEGYAPCKYCTDVQN